jgi:centromeric protein E
VLKRTCVQSGNDKQPVIYEGCLSHIKRPPTREYLLRCSYLEIYNLLSPPSVSATQPVQIVGQGVLGPLREEEWKEERHRRTASTDWNERSSRSHSVFRLVIESRERGEGKAESSGRQTPGMRPPTPERMGRTRLQTAGGRSVQMSVLVRTFFLPDVNRTNKIWAS